ncbi:hypothetical protein H671_2g5259 [Cricetulus griseus]|nr:hypothetical protein H671_2g5259 [Cricetulus griseus]
MSETKQGSEAPRAITITITIIKAAHWDLTVVAQTGLDPTVQPTPTSNPESFCSSVSSSGVIDVHNKNLAMKACFIFIYILRWKMKPQRAGDHGQHNQVAKPVQEPRYLNSGLFYT